MKIPGSTN